MTTQPLSLTDLPAHRPGTARLLHGLAARSPARFLHRVAEVGWDLASTSLLDRLAPLRGGLLREARGRAAPRGRALCLYAHWSPDGRISAMVEAQVAGWQALGFDMVFVSNSAVPDADWDRIGDATIWRMARRNVGRDFGAWRDAAARVLPELGTPSELLLANDSVLGPIRPLAPLVAAWRAGGEGLFGMTESRGGGAHLQSYALLARGAPAVGVLLAHLAQMRDGRSKWRLVQQGEIGLARRVQAAGLRCAALFGHDRALGAIGEDTRRALGPRFTDPSAFARYPLNPTHHLWRELVEALGFPYLKTELVRRNPGRLPGVSRWREVVPTAELPLIEAHLAALGG